MVKKMLIQLPIVFLLLMILSGADYDNIIWPVTVRPWIKIINTKNWNIVWTINLRCLTLKEIGMSKKFDGTFLPNPWFEKFGFKKLYTKDLTTNINYSPNFIRTRVTNLLTPKNMDNSKYSLKL